MDWPPSLVHRCRFYLPDPVWVRLSSGGSGVIFPPDNTPGLTPSPGRCRLCSEVLVPVVTVRWDQCARARKARSPGFVAVRTAAVPARLVVSGGSRAYPLRTSCGLGHTMFPFRLAEGAAAHGTHDDRESHHDEDREQG